MALDVEITLRAASDPKRPSIANPDREVATPQAGVCDRHRNLSRVRRQTARDCLHRRSTADCEDSRPCPTACGPEQLPPARTPGLSPRLESLIKHMGCRSGAHSANCSCLPVPRLNAAGQLLVYVPPRTDPGHRRTSQPRKPCRQYPLATGNASLILPIRKQRFAVTD